MGQTLTEKILARGAGRASVRPGETIWVQADLFMTHDVFGPEVFRDFLAGFHAVDEHVGSTPLEIGRAHV